MDFSAANTALWNIVVQLGILSCAVIVSTMLARKIPGLRRFALPTSVLAGFLLLALRSFGVIRMDLELLEMLTYHGIAIGFIAMSLRVPKPDENRDDGAMTGAKSGALIVSTYLVQALMGLAITLLLGVLFMPGLFKASGILLPMGFGQGPGQANNIGSSYEALGFAGGRSFGLSIAASGYLCACVVGLFYINFLKRKGALKKADPMRADAVTLDDFQSRGEIPVSESIDRFSIQIVLVLIVYFLTYLVCSGIDRGLTSVAPGLGKTVSGLLWGFNFIIGSALALLIRFLIKKLTRSRFITRQYQNNYLLSRVSGFAFDVMIIAGIASINIEDLTGLWVPFVLLTIAGGVGTLFYLRYLCRKLYPGYFYESLTSMYGMLTGTISSGVLLLREIDPAYETPAANNLVLGSSFGILFGAPVLLLVGLAPRSDWMTVLVFVLCAAYLALLLLFMLRYRRKAPAVAPAAEEASAEGPAAEGSPVTEAPAEDAGEAPSGDSLE